MSIFGIFYLEKFQKIEKKKYRYFSIMASKHGWYELKLAYFEGIKPIF